MHVKCSIYGFINKIKGIYSQKKINDLVHRALAYPVSLKTKSERLFAGYKIVRFAETDNLCIAYTVLFQQA